VAWMFPTDSDEDKRERLELLTASVTAKNRAKLQRSYSASWKTLRDCSNQRAVTAPKIKPPTWAR
jgi:hypothetical protein